MKENLRKIFLEKRKSASREDLTRRSKQINDNFLENLLPRIYQKNSKENFSLYLATPDEVSTTLIAKYFEKNKKTFSYPKILKKNYPLEFILFDEHTKFITNKSLSKISEPNEGKKILPDFLIIPLVAFDSNLSRLGMGGGFFDRTIESLKKTKSRIVTIGLAFDFQLSIEPLPTQDTDQSLDFIVTENDIFSSDHTRHGLTHEFFKNK